MLGGAEAACHRFPLRRFAQAVRWLLPLPEREPTSPGVARSFRVSPAGAASPLVARTLHALTRFGVGSGGLSARRPSGYVQNASGFLS
jgi:hypothetical protein